jgi:hypothetical protein
MFRKILFLGAGVCLAGVITAFVISSYTEKTQASMFNDVYQTIDDKALVAQNRQQNSVSELVDTIFASYGVTELPANLVASLKDRIVRAEVNGQAINESQVAVAVNWLANEFSAPAYARTSPLQMRVSRVKLNRLIPNLFVDTDTFGNRASQKQVNSEISHNVSPSQATCLLLIIVQQKMLNADYQKSPEQWESDFYASQETAAADSPPENTPPRLAKKQNTQKSNEMYQLLYNPNLTAYDADRLAHGALDQLGIPR